MRVCSECGVEYGEDGNGGIMWMGKNFCSMGCLKVRKGNENTQEQLSE